MHRKPSTLNRQPCQGQCAFVRGSMHAAGTWAFGGKLHHRHGTDDGFPAPGEQGVEAG